jgi:methylisocitrate lyase
MLHITTTPAERRIAFRKALKSGKLQRFAGAFSPFVAMLLEQQGFEGIYIPGASLANELGLPDVALTTLTEVSGRGYQIVRQTNLPTIIDVDTGFGEPQSAYRTVREMESLGICCIHIEDQQEPKRCGHLDNKKITSVARMNARLRAALDARLDPNFLIMARTDARAVEGLDAAIDRAKAYVDAGAEAIFCEAMHDEREYEAFRKAVDVPLLSNMTAFGQSKLLTAQQLQDLGINIVIYPNTTFRLAMKAIEDYMPRLLEEGIQTGFIDKLQPRSRLYEILGYGDYNRFGEDTFDFDVPDGEGQTAGQTKTGQAAAD